MPKRRKCTLKNLPNRQCKKPKISISLRQKRGMVNYDDSKYDVLDFVDESDNLSETIEISSEDSKEKEVSPINDCESGNSSDVVIIENKDSLFESMVSTFKDTTFIDVSVENNEESPKCDSVLPDNVITHNIETPKTSNNLSSAVSLSSSETKSTSSTNKKRKSHKAKQIIPVVPPVSEEIFYVEKILDMKTVNGKKMFLLKWEGFPDSDNTWEPEENIQTNVMVQDFLNNLNNLNINVDQDNASLNIERSDQPDVVDVDNYVKASTPNDTHNKYGLDNMILTNEDNGVQQSDVHQSPVTIESDVFISSYPSAEYGSESDACENRPKSKEPINIEFNENQDNQTIEMEPDSSSIGLTMPSLVEGRTETNEPNGSVQQSELSQCDVEPAPPPAPTKPRLKVGRKSREEANLLRDLDSSFWDFGEGRSSRRRRRLMSLTEILNQTDDRSPSSDTAERIKTRSNCSASLHDDQKIGDLSSTQRSRNHSQHSNSDSNIAKPNNQVDQVSDSVINDESAQPSSKDPNSYFPSNMPQTVQEIFMVEKILKMKVFNGVRKFFLKWEGFPDSENTWEPEENLECPELIKEFLKQKRLKQKIRKRNKIISVIEEPLMLEELPEEVIIKEPIVKPRGFPRSREAESILAAGILNDQLMFLIKWKNMDMANLVSARRANLECPQVVIRYYEAHLNWQNADDTITTAPKDPIYRNMPGEAARQAIMETKKRSGFDESVDELISMITSGKGVPSLQSPAKVAKQPRIPKVPKSQLTHSLANRFTSPHRIRKPRQKKLTPIRSLAPGGTHPGLLQSRPGPDRSSVSMMNLIRNFKDRKSEPPHLPTAVTPSPVARTPGLDNSQPPLGATCQYQSRDIPRETTPPPRFERPKVSATPILRNINSYRGDMMHSIARRTGGSSILPPLSVAMSSLSAALPSLSATLIASSASVPVANSDPSMGARGSVVIHYLQSSAPLTTVTAPIGGIPSMPPLEFGGQMSMMSGGPSFPHHIQQQQPQHQVQGGPGRLCHPAMPGSMVGSGLANPGALQQIHALTSSIGTPTITSGLPKFGSIRSFTGQPQGGLDVKAASRVQLAAAIQSRYQHQGQLPQQQQQHQSQSMVLMHHPNLIQGATDASPLIIYQGNAQQPAQYQYVINQPSGSIQSPWQHQTDFHNQQQQQQCLMIPSIDSMGSYTLQADLTQHLLHQAPSQSSFVSLSPQQQLQHQQQQQQQQPLMKQDPPDRMQNSFMNLRAFL